MVAASPWANDLSGARIERPSVVVVFVRGEVSRVRLAVLVLAVAVLTAPAAAWLMGDQSEASGVDHMVQPIDPPRWVAALLGEGSPIGTAAAAIVLLRLIRQGRAAPGWAAALAAFAAAGVLVGIGYRIVTAGVGGANIGGGLFVMGGVPAIVTLWVVGFVAIVRASRAPETT